MRVKYLTNIVGPLLIARIKLMLIRFIFTYTLCHHHNQINRYCIDIKILQSYKVEINNLFNCILNVEIQNLSKLFHFLFILLHLCFQSEFLFLASHVLEILLEADFTANCLLSHYRMEVRLHHVIVVVGFISISKMNRIKYNDEINVIKLTSFQLTSTCHIRKCF